jgi:tripartite ATP-independent transporter DctM subunit
MAQSTSLATADVEHGRLERGYDLFARLTALFNGIGTVWVFLIMLLIVADIVAREAFNAPIRGVAEMVAFSILGAVFLQLAHSLHTGRFTRAEMLIDSLENSGALAGHVFNTLFSAFGVAVFAVISAGIYVELLNAWPDLRYGTEGDFVIYVWPLRLTILCGAVLAGLEFFFQFLRNAAGLWRDLGERARGRSGRPAGWIWLAILTAVGIVAAAVGANDMPRIDIGFASLLAILVLICLGLHIAVALVTVSFLALFAMMGGDPYIAFNTVKLAANEYLRDYFFAVVPLFVAMGLLVKESDVGEDTFDVARWMLQRVKGGLGVATVFANAIFAAITGSSIASAAVFTKIAAPMMIDNGYTVRFAVGTVAGSSVLGMLIPPSLLLIIYAFVSETSVGILFLAAVVPGLILAGAFGLAVFAMAHFWPSFVGSGAVTGAADGAGAGDAPQESARSATIKLAPIAALIALVLGGIYSGFFTPVEAGAVGAFGALVIGVVRRRLTIAKLWQVLLDTGHVTVAILFLILAANIYGRMLALSGMPQHMGAMIGDLGLGFYGFMLLYLVLVVVLGMFLDSASIMLIVLPLVLPIVSAFGGDLVWFGIVTVIAVEMGLLTPPLGISCYVVRSTIDDSRVTLNQIFAGAFPFVVIMALVTALLVLVPELSLVFL